MRRPATYATNRVDSFVKFWMLDDRDELRRQFIRDNFDHFRASPTFWLPVGKMFIVHPPNEAFLELERMEAEAEEEEE